MRQVTECVRRIELSIVKESIPSVVVVSCAYGYFPAVFLMLRIIIIAANFIVLYSVSGTVLVLYI